ncbi:lycopene cyclase family protein [Streptomyces sp. HNM0663]|uniref:Lycopene cyclase family protein n=1 Tax=Streptomyces chengmaiensis TaxID=3040919 RepID=A0ABT6HJ94_9ACTN|nr:lycopene cyclase family protein [Streptomyces chengmaiensis]MDH2388411.1 lycopene cyclase family protein [Streptomyces chengmaiensis]
MELKADVAVVGAGAAGLSLALRLARPPSGAAELDTVLLAAPPGPARAAPRTWCFWEPAGGPYDEALAASWQRLRVHGRDGTAVTSAIAPLRYKMLRSDAFEELAGRRIAASGRVSRVEAAAERVTPTPGGSLVHARRADGGSVAVRARWVFDSRPLTRLPPARTTLLQHFRGWFVRTPRPVFDPSAVELMDFRTPQPARGLSFGYVLPVGPREALVEYTEFSRRVLGPAAYDRALRHYAQRVLGLAEYEITACEQGVIPMTDAGFVRRPAPGVFRIGACSGATRPSTGYTFSAVQRQAGAVASALHAGRHPLPPPPHSARARLMDAVLLHALDSGRVDGPAFFTRLFGRVPAPRLLRFLDGRTSLSEDLSIGAHAPVAAMLASALTLPFAPRRNLPAGAFPPPDTGAVHHAASA